MKRYTPSFEQSLARKVDQRRPQEHHCYRLCSEYQVECPNKECRLWIDFPDDLNCTQLTVEKNKKNKMIFQEIGKRLNLTPSRIKQIEVIALKKMKVKTNKLLNIL